MSDMDVLKEEQDVVGQPPASAQTPTWVPPKSRTPASKRVEKNIFNSKPARKRAIAKATLSEMREVYELLGDAIIEREESIRLMEEEKQRRNEECKALLDAAKASGVDLKMLKEML
ncbi:hypothetical protein LRP52_23825 [Photobacterium sp. ZSDE20]|uniref:Uncharacterized protein n=1 Tax=Photobacterium pectinilyticum TaxID=2906793 RepID=A0ABT1N163_9GAMM|nr:hypothetical protein [Photobacterium sp. ZSDE20]MCQ1058414.1 hypothetical protein [Photobacterium sp. ZSDE20]MDD1825223.1 hypothetical protein [Photobacterium sp. ZSDE20]